MRILNDLADPPKSYRPVPFWSWNERLDTATTRAQVRAMDEAGIGGFFMHARGGLQTPYMGEEWFDNIRAACDEGTARGMAPWGYDENGWPSGYGDSKVNALGVAYQQKYLRCARKEAEACPCPPEQVIGVVQAEGYEYCLYYEINPFYVDTLDAAVTAKFLEMIHETYRSVLGADFGGMTGFFTDEPQVSRNGIPWSFTLPDAYAARYGEELLPRLPGLFVPVGDYRRTRYRFWSLVRDLFADHFMKPIYDWCTANGSRLTGHMVLEETMYSQLVSNGACMPCYEFFHIPGMDWLTRSDPTPLTPLQLASVAHQLGKKQILSETFALCGWDVGFSDLRHIYETQMVRGVNLLCQHLEGYSLRGIRKRDYPASLFVHQPWWPQYKPFNDFAARIGMLLAEGTVRFSVLLLHPQGTAWVEYDDSANGSLNAYDQALAQTIDALEARAVPFHLGDERILERHGRVEGDRLHVGTQTYSVIVVPPSTTYSRHTASLLETYKAAGGRLIFVEEPPSLVEGEPDGVFARLADGCPLVRREQAGEAVPDDCLPFRLNSGSSEPLLATCRWLEDDGLFMVYVVNPGEETAVTLCADGAGAAQLDAMTGAVLPVRFAAAEGQVTITHTIAAQGSAVFFIAPDDRYRPAEPEEKPPFLPDGLLRGVWEIAESDDNALTLDYCDAYVDGELIGRHLPVGDIQEMACAYRRAIQLRLEFAFDVAALDFQRLSLALETPEIFTLTINGAAAAMQPLERYRDDAFRLVDIRPYIRQGANTLVLETRFEQRASVYDDIEKALQFETEKNKLTYDMEIEAVMLIGDFGVQSAGAFQREKRDTVRTTGPFTLTSRPERVTDGNLAMQGFPFFNGRMTLRREISLEQAGRCRIGFARRGATVMNVRINGRDAGCLRWAPYEIDTGDLLTAGVNVVEVELVTSLRNLLGPFHVKEESYAVGPFSFFRHSPIWGDAPWDDGYLLAEHGLFF